MMTNAQNQHYVPKFILRNFLSDGPKDQVSVYDKHEDRVFVTSVKNIMAERPFNDFSMADWIVSFENIDSKIEEMILPTYRRIITERRLNGSAEEKADLGFLMAFQFIRTKGSREFYQNFEDGLRKKLESTGDRLENIEGW